MGLSVKRSSIDKVKLAFIASLQIITVDSTT